MKDAVDSSKEMKKNEKIDARRASPDFRNIALKEIKI